MCTESCATLIVIEITKQPCHEIDIGNWVESEFEAGISTGLAPSKATALGNRQTRRLGAPSKSIKVNLVWRLCSRE